MKGIEGSTLGRYELRRRIARGGMSEVYLGYDRRVRRRVAVKVLYGSDEPFVRRFEREALAVGTLSHDHILPLYDFGEQRPWYYLVMPYIEGGTLRDYLFKRQRLTLETAGSFLEQIASALQYAHDHGVVHRDVKPSNILLRPDGHAYLVDFGLAKAKMEAGSLSHTGGMVGTPEYMAPEQSNGQNDYRSDIYSLGVILYQMLTGQVPFIAESPVAVTLKHLQAPPPPPRQFNSDIPQAVEDVILVALAKDPNERYQEAKALSEAYRKALQQELLYKHDEDAVSTTLSVEQSDGTASSPESGATSSTVLAPALEQILTATGKPRLFPLEHELLSMPSVSDVHPGKSRRYTIILATLCFLFLITTIPLGILWQARQIAPKSNLQQTPGTTIQQWATATTQARISAQATLAAQARAQATAGITSAIGAGNVLFASDMASSREGWIDDGYQCFFSSQGYHVSTQLTHAAAWCYYNRQQYANAVITAQAQLLRGDIYGLVFRLSPTSRAFYVLELNSRGDYRFQRAQGDNPGAWLTLIDWTHSAAIHTGYGHINTFLLVVTGSHFSFYINQQLITSAYSDTTYASGLIGFLVGGDSNGGTEAVFSNVWVFQK